MKIPKRIAATLINSLKGGVVPRIGLPYITVGRENEINALLHDVDIIADGGASFRFIMGKYGSGKSFLLQTIRNYVMDRNFVVCDADLSPERRLQGTKGQGLATYKELIRNISTKTRPGGGLCADHTALRTAAYEQPEKVSAFCVHCRPAASCGSSLPAGGGDMEPVGKPYLSAHLFYQDR